MVRIDRSQSFTELNHRGVAYTLTVERIDISWGGKAGTIGASYVRPRAIAHNGRIGPILDLVMLVRLIGLLAVAAAMFVTEVRR